MSNSGNPPPTSFLPLLYAMDGTYGWGKGMRAITTAFLDDYLPQNGRILEIGCGSGIFLQQLAKQFPEMDAIGSDLHPLALVHAEYVNRQAARLTTEPAIQFVQNDLHHLPFTDNCMDLVIALDVFDQAGVKLATALEESRRVLRCNGYLLLRVSAYSWLWGEHDRIFNTGQRYDRAPLVKATTAAGFTIARISYANTLLAPPVIGMRLLQRWLGYSHSEEHYTHPFSNRLLAAALQWEAKWIQRHNLPAGISLYMLARKDV